VLSYFRNGLIPTQKHYEDLINSMLHKEDDGFSKDDENGFKIYSDNEFNRLVSFYKDSDATDPFFRISKDKAIPDCLKMQPYDPSLSVTDNDNNDTTAVFFHTSGKLGVGKKCEDTYKVEVDGFIGMTGRLGTYQCDTIKKETILADGKWHTIVPNLKNAQAFEIIARTGKKGTGKLAIMHAVALSVAGPKGGRIRRTNGYYGFFWNKIKLRWIGSYKDYSLQIKTNSNYGDDVLIHYTLTRLWDDALFLSNDEYDSSNDSK